MAVRGEDPSLWSVPAGFFPPTSPLASDAGLSVLTGKRDYAAVKRALEIAGYQGEKVVQIVATDIPMANAASNITADVLKRVGINVEYQAMDWGTVAQRRTSTKPPHEGGWNLFCVGLPGLFCFTPATHVPLRGAGKAGWFGWPNDPRMEELRDAWFNAPDLPAQKKIGEQMQLKGFENVPSLPARIGTAADRAAAGHCRRARGISALLEYPPKLSAPRRCAITLIAQAAIVMRPQSRSRCTSSD